MVGLSFAAAAYAKLTIGGFAWVRDGAVKFHFAEDSIHAPYPLGLWVASHHEVAVFLSAAAILAEATMGLAAFFPGPLPRAMFGLLMATLLSGFYVFQGVFWWPWWLLLISFLPWQLIGTATLPRPASGRPTAALGPAHAAIVATILAQQVYVSARDIEVKPLMSNFPMYARSWDSTEAFDQRRSGRFRRYRFMHADRDLTDWFASLRGAQATLLNAAQRPRAGQELPEDARDQVRAILIAYQDRFEDMLDQIDVFEDLGRFDWQRGTFVYQPAEQPIATTDLRRHAALPARGAP